MAADIARFCEVYVRLGLAPGGGGAWLLRQIVGLRQTEDHQEGLRALQERRLPRFRGR